MGRSSSSPNGRSIRLCPRPRWWRSSKGFRPHPRPIRFHPRRPPRPLRLRPRFCRRRPCPRRRPPTYPISPTARRCRRRVRRNSARPRSLRSAARSRRASSPRPLRSTTATSFRSSSVWGSPRRPHDERGQGAGDPRRRGYAGDPRRFGRSGGPRRHRRAQVPLPRLFVFRRVRAGGGLRPVDRRL